ncbi:TetR/AcrR family transcriptional regulator [Brevibacillus sp. B_LB10_24]|uniref:TetR/AcrR family transcriptional regulator n=1 Tax=Brevibacillus sp. B_LB10_24 TaxID=3380645 RepID=UPI0038BB6823
MPKARPELFDAFIAATTSLINEQGVVGVHIEKLCEQLSVSKGSFYWYFKNKEELLVRVAIRFHQKTTIELIKANESIPDPLERIRQMIKNSFQVLIADRIHREIWALTFVYPELQSYMQQVDEERVDYIHKQFLLAEEEGRLKPGTCLWLHSLLLVSTFSGLLMRWALEPSEQPTRFDAAADYVTDLFVNNLEK